jgi:hypothetical protein
MPSFIAPELREFIRRGLEVHGYHIERPAVRGLSVRCKGGSRPLTEGMVYRDREPIMAIMKARDCFLVVTASHGGRDGTPYHFGFGEAQE